MCMTHISVGQKLPYADPSWKNKAIAALSWQEAPVFHLMVPGPTEIELKAMGADLRFHLFADREILYVVINSNNVLYWECPFHASIEQFDRSRLSPIPKGEGLAVTCIFIDSADFAVKRIRSLAWTNSFSNKAISLVDGQLAAPMDRKEYQKRIMQTYAQHSIMDMSRQGIATCRAGQKEDFEN